MSASVRPIPIRLPTVEDVWGELLSALCRAADDFDRLDEYEQASALREDARYLAARSTRHVRNLSKR